MGLGLALLGAVAAGCLAGGQAGSASSRPHLVYILTDNLGYGGTGYLRARSPTGASPEIQTPNIDRLAATGVVLDRLYTYKFCSPSRSSLLSGRLPIHVNLHNSDQTMPGAGIPINMTTIAEKLSAAGYSTHQIGKWHTGFSTWRKTPQGRGFDTSFGYFYAFNGYLAEWAAGHCPGVPGGVSYNHTSEAAMCTNASIYARNLSFTTDLWDTTGPARGLNGTAFEEGMFVERAVGIIQGHGRSEQPLFLYYAQHLLHSPLCAPREYLQRFAFVGDEDRRYVSAMTAFMDDTVGAVADALKRTGLWDNTFLVWSSDNGAAIEIATGAKNAYPLKGGYYTNWEGGIRAPGLLSGGLIEGARTAGSTLTGYVHLCDFYATFCHLAGCNTSDPLAAATGLPAIDSLDMHDYFFGLNASSPRTEIALTPLSPALVGNHPGRGNESAYILGEYKLIVNAIAQSSWEGPQYPNASVWDTWSTMELCTTSTKAGCLYNIIQDPTEHHDLAMEMPDKVQQLLSRLQDVQATVFDPPRGDPDTLGACAALADSYGGFWGPWLSQAEYDALGIP